MPSKDLNAAQLYEKATSMKAIAMTEFPDIGNVVGKLRMIEASVPRPKPNEVAIKLSASSLHIDEIYFAQGTGLGRFFGPKVVSETQPYIMGSSVSGCIVGVGHDVTNHAIGDEVIVIPNTTGETGYWATYRCVEESMVMLKPSSLTHVQAAAMTMASCVAYGAVEYGAVNPSDNCLVVGASGAIGSLIVQILKSQGAHVTGVCSGRNAELVLSKGADEVIDYTTTNFGDLTKGSFDKVFDIIGGRETERQAFKVLKRSGRFVTIVGPIQHIGERKLSWPEFLRGFSHVIWRIITSRVYGPHYIFGEKRPKLAINDALRDVVKHNMKMPIEQEVAFDLEEVKAAVRLLTSHRARGRIVIDFTL